MLPCSLPHSLTPSLPLSLLSETSGSFDGKPLREGPPPSPEADADEYTVCSGLGQGGYSQVVLVRDPVAGGFAAMKVIDKMKLNRSRDRTRLRNELWALTQMTPSPFLLQLRSAFGTLRA